MGLEMFRIHQKSHGDVRYQFSKRFDIKNPVKMTPVLLLLAGVEKVISQEPDVADPKCGISNMNIPPTRIQLVGVPDLKS